MSFLKQTFSKFPRFIQKPYKYFRDYLKIVRWKRNNRPIPVPHAIKQQTVIFYQTKYGINTLIESGTYYGDMIWATQNLFSKIYSIELSNELAEFAQKRFKRQPHIKIIHGNSGKIMKNIVESLSIPTLFWLDGHYSSKNTARGDKDTPISEELKAILASPHKHIILIDDASFFNGQRDYPILENMLHYIKKQYPEANISIEDDIIIIEPEDVNDTYIEQEQTSQN